MSAVRPLEETLLSRAATALDHATFSTGGGFTARLDILEAVASRMGGWDLSAYREAFEEEHSVRVDDALGFASSILVALQESSVPLPLALSSLARPVLQHMDRRRDGVYYTDFRLAQFLAKGLIPALSPTSSVLDPASGTGTLLAAVILAVCGEDRASRAQMIAHSIAAADLSPAALRGARLTIASLTDDLNAVSALNGRLRNQDSLIIGSEGWSDIAPSGFDAVVINPPWEKLKVTRHEFLVAAGADRHYGDDYGLQAMAGSHIARERAKLARYAVTLEELYPLSGHGEPDLYRAFVELSFQIIRRDRGHVCMIVPAGLIRSQGTEEQRRAILDASASTEISVIENRARFFSIDSRFKFLVLHAEIHDGKRSPIRLQHARGDESGVIISASARIGRRALASTRRDLTIPEVRNEAEWRLFRKMARQGASLREDRNVWGKIHIVREIDMTRDRHVFRRDRVDDALPLVEGRMVHQFRCGAKSYRGGTGRRAVWTINPPGDSEIAPQFWIPMSELPESMARRASHSRIGFCDVTGQTNERSMLAARIPAGVVCGNKVPTITFVEAMDAEDRLGALWLAAANSFAFDWLLRRIVTTTVNYFLLLSVPFPIVAPDSLPGRRLVELVRGLSEIGAPGHVSEWDPWTRAEVRAEIDTRIFAAYGLEYGEAELVMRDFPLLDRGQPPLPGERRSSVTKDLVLARAADVLGGDPRLDYERVEAACQIGAIPYVPSDYNSSAAASVESIEEGVTHAGELAP